VQSAFEHEHDRGQVQSCKGSLQQCSTPNAAFSTMHRSLAFTVCGCQPVIPEILVASEKLRHSRDHLYYSNDSAIMQEQTHCCSAQNSRNTGCLIRYVDGQPYASVRSRCGAAGGWFSSAAAGRGPPPPHSAAAGTAFRRGARCPGGPPRRARPSPRSCRCVHVAWPCLSRHLGFRVDPHLYNCLFHSSSRDLNYIAACATEVLVMRPLPSWLCHGKCFMDFS
jgi:hypothetical protein